MTQPLARATKSTAGIPNGVRTGTVAAINSDGTVQVTITGVAVTAGTIQPVVVGQTVFVLVQDSSWLVLGAPNQTGPRGIVAFAVFSGAPYSTVSGVTTETVMATLGALNPDVGFVDGRAFRVIAVLGVDSTTAQHVLIRIRETDASGVNLVSGPGFDTIAGGVDVPAIRAGVFINTSGANFLGDLALTFQPATTTAINLTGLGAAASMIMVEDIGDAGLFTGAVSL